MRATLFDTKSSRKIGVTLELGAETLRVVSETGTESYPADALRFSERLGQMPRTIHLPDGRVCETDDNDAVDAYLAAHQRDRFAALLHTLETNLRYVFAAFLATAIFSYLFVTYGLPLLADRAAANLPPALVYRLGSGTLATLDSHLLKPSELPDARREALRRTFLQYVDTGREWPRVRVLFRSGKIGPNAFALPDGTVIFTDALVRLAEDDRELLGIFFHELGHIERRHALRTLLQDSVFYLLVTSVTGDVTMASSMLAALPTLLVENSYSRTMEREADDFAYDAMVRDGIPPEQFAAILERLMRYLPDEKEGDMMSYLSSHPLTLERIAKFRRAQ